LAHEDCLTIRPHGQRLGAGVEELAENLDLTTADPPLDEGFYSQRARRELVATGLRPRQAMARSASNCGGTANAAG
jgi:hypothetical protein